ncbi:hypothetical protein PMI07_000847 [Rhizobium sp. CF080]|uniref:hypothetical protein n=1 Tax=Rhizobium sp. (strain CF080) TaxID=1144310 RepID=UPI000271BCBD|nr:hypothetical protein [Rhizobium sp. CF080]EUB97271.1 hypothetical protein PMI07_000847 [Rhizobium sp. CF080]
MKSTTHEITIRVRFDALLSKKQAVYAVRNHLQDHTIYGDGRLNPMAAEPYSVAKIRVPK